MEQKICFCQLRSFPENFSYCRLGLLKDMTKGLPVKQSIFQFVDRGNEEYTFDIMCKVERGETSLQEAKQKYRMILDKRKAKINTAKRLSTIEGVNLK